MFYYYFIYFLLLSFTLMIIVYILTIVYIYIHFFDKGMLSSEYCWAFHSECTEELLAMMPGMKRNEPSWPELRAHGAGWWVRSNDIMKRTIEKVLNVIINRQNAPTS